MEPTGKEKISFRFENMWMTRPYFKENLKEWWSLEVQETTVFRLSTKLSEFKGRLINMSLKMWKQEKKD